MNAFSLVRYAVALAALTAALAGCGHRHTSVVIVSPKGDVTELPSCATGCSALPIEMNPEVSQDELRGWFAEVGALPVEAESLAVDSLVFFADEARAYLGEHPDALPPDHTAWLQDELARTHATIEFRVVDELGQVRAVLEPSDVPLGIKQHVHLHRTGSLAALEAGGTVRRVGLHHLWSRW